MARSFAAKFIYSALSKTTGLIPLTIKEAGGAVRAET